MTAQTPLWFESMLDGWWGTLILALFCALDVLLLSVIFYRAFMKRFYDLLLSAAGILLLIPVWLILTPIVAVKMKGNPFFVQTRPGKKCKNFKLIKYRTMTQERDADGNDLPDAERLTRFGRVMRKLSLDELPELFNIFAGRMSLVGPRPLLVQYVPLYTREQLRRHAVRPGLTGLAQVSGRNAITWEERLRLDVRYVDTFSFFGDLKILFLTVYKVLKRDGISEEGQATKSFFTGTAIAEAAASRDGDDAGRAGESVTPGTEAENSEGEQTAVPDPAEIDATSESAEADAERGFRAESAFREREENGAAQQCEEASERENA